MRWWVHDKRTILLVMDAPKCECEFKIDLYIGYYSHHILRIMCGFFNIPLNMQGCETGSTVYLSHARRLESLAVCRCHCKSNRVSLVILRPRVLVWPGFEPSTSCLAYRRLSNRAAVSSKISGFRYNAMFTFMIFILTFSLCSRFGFISSCCFCSLWIQPWSGTHQGIRPSSFLLTAFTAPHPLISTIIISPVDHL